MGFDISTAVAVDDSPSGVKSTGNFDISTARAVDVQGGKTNFEQFQEEFKARVPVIKEGVPQIDTAALHESAKTKEPTPLGKGYPGADFLNSTVTLGMDNITELATKPLGIDVKGLTEEKEQISGEHPVASIIAGTAPFIATAPLFPGTLLGVTANFAAVGGLSELGHQRVDESLMKPTSEKAEYVLKETTKSALMGPVWHYSSALQFIGRPFASALVRAGVRGTGTASLDKVYGGDLAAAFKDGGTMTALSLIFESPALARTALGRGVIAHANGANTNTVEINPDHLDEQALKKQILNKIEVMADTMPKKQKEPSEHDKFLTPPKEIQIVNSETLKGMGEEGKMDVNLIPGVPEAAHFLEQAHNEYVTNIKPMDKSTASKLTAQELRKNIGEMVRSHDRFESGMRNASKIFEKASKESIIESYTKAEKGEKQSNPELQDIYDVLKKTMLDKAEEVRALGTGKLEDLIENYMPHVWAKPGAASKFFSKKPFEGPKAFLKKRIIGDFSEGIKAGLEPVSWNPVDLTMIKLREMDKYIMAHKTLNALKGQGLMKFVKVGGEVPEGFKKVNDRLSDVFSRGDKGEMILRGRWYGQQDAVHIIDNYLSPGLQGKFVYDLYRGAGNTLNQFQLGISAFHLGFTSMDATVSKFALGLNKLATKDVTGALKEFSSSPLAPVTNYMEGKNLLAAWRGESNDPLTNKIADLMASAGGRAKMDKFYATGMREQMAKALKEGKTLSIAMKTPMWLVEQMSRPIMEHIVPAQKAGVFHDLMKFELEAHPEMTHEQMVERAQKIWDSVDNRMGQLVYDNLFWNKTLKDLSMASVRSLGWNIGTIREIGGGVKDVPLSIKGIAKGEGMSYRTAYVMALPIIAGLYGSIYQYLATGKLPEEPRDYWFPKNGGIDKNGQPARVSLPTYMKDIYHYVTSPVRTVLNKLNPVNTVVTDMLMNRDFYGTKIVNEDDPLFQKGLDELKFLGSQFTPFSVSNLGKNTKEDIGSKVQPFVGITPAPYDVSMTKAERAANEMSKGKVPIGARTKEQSAHSKQKSDIRNKYFSNKDIKPVKDAVRKGIITLKEQREIVKESKMTGMQRLTNHLSYEEVQSLYSKATPSEKVEIDKILRKKKANKQHSGTWTKDEETLFKKHFGY